MLIQKGADIGVDIHHPPELSEEEIRERDKAQGVDVEAEDEEENRNNKRKEKPAWQWKPLTASDKDEGRTYPLIQVGPVGIL